MIVIYSIELKMYSILKQLLWLLSFKNTMISYKNKRNTLYHLHITIVLAISVMVDNKAFGSRMLGKILIERLTLWSLAANRWGYCFATVSAFNISFFFFLWLFPLGIRSGSSAISPHLCHTSSQHVILLYISAVFTFPFPLDAILLSPDLHLHPIPPACALFFTFLVFRPLLWMFDSRYLN